jgi:hypothetical protein
MASHAHASPDQHRRGETPAVHDPVDAWHDHTHDAKPQDPHTDQANVRQVVTIGILLAMSVAVASVSVWGFYRWYITTELNREEVVDPNQINSRLAPSIAVRWEKERQLKVRDEGGQLSLPTEEGKPNRSVTIRPLDEAMADVIKSYSSPARPAAGK